MTNVYLSLLIDFNHVKVLYVLEKLYILYMRNILHLQHNPGVAILNAVSDPVFLNFESGFSNGESGFS